MSTLYAMATAIIDSPPAGQRPKNPGSEVVLPGRVKLLWIASVWGSSLLYAVVRYNVFGGVEWSHLPLYVANKSFGLAAVCFIAGSYLTGKLFDPYPRDERRRQALAKFLGLSGFALAALHVFVSLAMLSPAYFEKFFDASGKYNLTGELAILFGALSITCLASPAVATLPYMYDSLGGDVWLRAQQIGYLALLASCGHTLTMGVQGWLDPAGWPGLLPPITLLGFLAAFLALCAKAMTMVRSRAAG